MAKYIVNKGFIDIETRERYTEGQEIDMTVKRAKEVEDNLKDYGIKFLDRIDNKKSSEDE